MRVSRGWGDCGNDAGEDCGVAAGDAGLASAARARGLIDEIDDRAFVAVKEADELAEIRRSYVVVDGVEVAVVGHVECVNTQPYMVDFATPVSEQWQAELAIELKVQREIFREALSIGRADVLLLNIDRRVREAGVNVDERAECELPGESEDSPANDAIRNVRRENTVDIGTNHGRGEGDVDIRKAV